MPPVVSRSRGDLGQIHCLLSRAANAFQSGAVLPCSVFLAASKTYNLRVFITGSIPKHLAINQVKAVWQHGLGLTLRSGRC